MSNININKIYCGDGAKLLANSKLFPDNSIDLVVTSPPYADRRKKHYGGPHPDDYVKWFMPFTKEIYRILKPNGSFILNIKENADRGERHIYVLKLVLEIKESGWFWIEDYIWHKKNSFPGKWPNRFRDSWEHCFHFTKNKKFIMFQDEVKVDIGPWANARLKNLKPKDEKRKMSQTDSGFGIQLNNWVGKDKVYPTNVIHIPTVSDNKSHCAVFPEDLPAWFIKLFTKKGDIVLDPFIGSGTTAVAAKNLERNYIGIDKSQTYVSISLKRLKAKSKSNSK